MRMPVYTATATAHTRPTTSSALGVAFFTSMTTNAIALTAMNATRMTTPHAMMDEKLPSSPKKRSGFMSPALASTMSSTVPTPTAMGAMT